MNIRGKFLSVNGITTAVTCRKGQGPVIVCIHGNSLSQKLFAPLWSDRMLSRFPMVSYDLPGHGSSSIPQNPEDTYSMSGYASHLESLLSDLGLDEVILLGFSMGGHIAIEAAGNNIGSVVRGLFTVGTPPLDSIEDFPAAFFTFSGGFSLFTERLTDYQISVIADNITDDNEVQQIMAGDIKKTDYRARKYLAESLNNGKFHSEHDFLTSTGIPIRITFGENDRMVNIDYVRDDRIRKLLGPRLKIFKDCEHLPDWAETEGFVNEFYSFLGEIIV